MSVFSLTSDDEFIMPSPDGEHVFVSLYKRGEDGFMHFSKPPSNNWGPRVLVGHTAIPYKSLEVFGTTIKGDMLKELANELKAMQANESYHVFLNRLGFCKVTGTERQFIRTICITTNFGWSKYGVKVPSEVLVRYSGLWKEIDMSNDHANVQGLVGTARRILEAKEAELAACKKELAISKNAQSLLEQKKDKEVKVVKDQLLALKATLRCLADD